MTKRVDDINGNLNISLPSYTVGQNGGTTLSHEDWMIVISVRLLRELQKLNALLHCHNFTDIPHKLERIKRNTTKKRKKKATVTSIRRAA